MEDNKSKIISINPAIPQDDKPSDILDKEIAQELVDKIQKMVEDRDAKCDAAKNQLIDQLKVTADKYRTATGPMEALRCMRMVNDGRLDDMEIYDEISQARDLAASMVEEVSKLVKRAEDLGTMEMDQLCDGFYEEDFISSGFTAIDLAFELMRLDLCRNVGPAAEDIVEFQNRTNEEINENSDKLEELFEKHPEFRELMPSSKKE